MPADEGGGLHHGQGVAPVKLAREPDQGTAGSLDGTARFNVVLLVEGQLLTQQEVFCCEYRRWTQTEAQETDDIDQQRQQRASETQYMVE